MGRGGNEQQTIEAQGDEGIAGDKKVTVVGGIEAPPEEPDPHRFRSPEACQTRAESSLLSSTQAWECLSRCSPPRDQLNTAASFGRRARTHPLCIESPYRPRSDEGRRRAPSA